MPVGMLIDTTRCILCKLCETECHKFYDLKDERLEGTDTAPELDAYHYVALQAKEVQRNDRTQVIGLSKRCLHCFNPACVSVCPVGALNKRANGAVVWDEHKCIGCRYCQNACPFDIPKFEWDVPWPKISKCIFCNEKRLETGGVPVCFDVCPTKAIRFGERADMIALAHERIRNEPGKYFDYIYGEHEVGGTAVMYISSVDPHELGFPEVEKEMYPEYTYEFLSKIPFEIGAIALFLAGTYLFRTRRSAGVKAAETATKEDQS